MNFKLLRNKDFSLLMMGKFASLSGTQMQDFALSLYVLKITGSATLFASVLIAAMIPQLILSPIAGVFADWLDRKKIIVYLDIVSGLIVSVFAVLYVNNGKLPLIGIYIFVILLTLSSVLYQPAIGTIIPTIIKKEDLVDANGINSLLMNVGNLMAPLIAASLFGFYGLSIILIINAVSFFIAAFGEAFINIPKNNSMPEKVSFGAFFKDFMEGVGFIKKKKLLLYLIVLAPILNFVFGPLFSTGFIYITKKVMQVSDFSYGLMEMIMVGSMILSPFITSKLAKKYSLGKILFLDVFVCSLLIAVMAITPSSAFLSLFDSNLVPAICVTVIGFLISTIMTTVNIALSAMFQKMVPISMMGRVGSVFGTCCLASIPLGQVVFGVMFDRLSTWLCVLIAALILMSAIMIFKNALWSTEDNEEVQTEVINILEAVQE